MRFFIFVFLCFASFLSPLSAAKKKLGVCFSGKRYAAIVVDGQTGDVLYERNANAIRHPASLVKKMTLYMIFEALRKGKISLKTEFRVSQHAANQMPCKLNLKPGEFITVENIIKGLVTKSANDAAVVAAEGLAGSERNFTEAMNKKSVELGMYNTRFFNASGVPHSQQVTTAHDMIVLARALYDNYPEFCHYLKIQNFHYKGARYANHNRLLGKVHGVVGIKTGFVNASGFNISTASERNGKRVFVVVLGGSTSRSRDQHTKELIEIGFRKILGSNTGEAVIRNLAVRELEKEIISLEEEASLCDDDKPKKASRRKNRAPSPREISIKKNKNSSKNSEKIPLTPSFNSQYATPVNHYTSFSVQSSGKPNSCVNWVMPEETQRVIETTKECSKPKGCRAIKVLHKNSKKRRNKIKKKIANKNF